MIPARLPPPIVRELRISAPGVQEGVPDDAPHATGVAAELSPGVFHVPTEPGEDWVVLLPLADETR